MLRKKGIWFYGIFMGVLLLVLRYFEYRFLIREIQSEMYAAVLALLFLALGIWAGIHFNRKHGSVHLKRKNQVFFSNHSELSQREFEVLQLLAAGYSNREIADRLFISLNTVKTHLSNLYLKLDVKRRTQAIKKARELNIIA